MITCYGVESYTPLACVAQRHAARDSSVHDPLLGHGDPYGLEADPNSASHAPTPAAITAGMAKVLKLCLSCLLLLSRLQPMLRSSVCTFCINAMFTGSATLKVPYMPVSHQPLAQQSQKFVHSIAAGRF